MASQKKENTSQILQEESKIEHQTVEELQINIPSPSLSHSNSTPGTALLWDCKLKSRESFKMVLQFLNVRRRELRDIIGVLEPVGSDEFFQKHIKNGA